MAVHFLYFGQFCSCFFCFKNCPGSQAAQHEKRQLPRVMQQPQKSSFFSRAGGSLCSRACGLRYASKSSYSEAAKGPLRPRLHPPETRPCSPRGRRSQKRLTGTHGTLETSHTAFYLPETGPAPPLRRPPGRQAYRAGTRGSGVEGAGAWAAPARPPAAGLPRRRSSPPPHRPSGRRDPVLAGAIRFPAGP